MRILMITDTVGGVWTYTRELVEGLLKARCKVTLVTMGRAPSPEQSSWSERISNAYPSAFRLVPTRYKLEWMQEYANCYFESRDLLLQLVDSFRPDLIHSNQFCYGALPVDIPRIVVAHSDVLSWLQCCRPEAPASHNDSTWLINYVDLVSAGLRSATALVAPTRWMLNSLEQNYTVPKWSAIIPNGRDIRRLTARSRKLQAITAGRLWDEAKNISILESVHTSLPILVAGEAELDGEASLTSRGLHLLGPLRQDELLTLMAESSIYIATSCYEPFGLAPLEAALSGCAIVANDIPSLREVWDDAAIYFKNARGLARILTDLSNDPQRLHGMAERAFHRATKNYTADAMTVSYLNLYRNAASTHYSTTYDDELGRRHAS
ncbi:MAG TPA: glycosyltransferase family 4 protein [Acidisarcina sp.]